MVRRAKKPKILADKIKLANLIKEKWLGSDFSKHRSGYYWHGKFRESETTDTRIYIYFQLYVRRLGVDYVDIHWYTKEGQFGKALKPKEIKDLLGMFKNKIS